MTKPAKIKRTRIDAASSKAAVIQAATRKISAPESMALNARELKFFEGIAAEFPKADLGDHRLTMIAVLARDLSAYGLQSEALNKEGFTITRPSGLIAKNPRLDILHGLIGQILALRRSLALHGNGLTGGDNRNARRRRAIALGYEADADPDDGPEDRLINRPKIH